MLPMHDLVIYHGGCIDGFTSAWVAWRELGDDAEYVPAFYPTGDQFVELPDVTGRDVLMVDFCVGREQLLELERDARSIKVLDHHKSHRDVCRDLEFCIFDMEQSGAGLTWRYFKGMSNPPWLVAYVEDRDLWRFKLEDSKAINAYVSTFEHAFEAWRDLQRVGKKVAASRGRAVLAYIERYVLAMSKEARRIRFPAEMAVAATKSRGPGHWYKDIPVVNAPYINTSELVGHLAQDALFAVGWFQRADGLYQYSLRSKGDFDVSALAKNYGGGGHAQSAGFAMKELVHE